MGYVVSKNINTIRYSKNFATKKNSIEKNLELANDWLADLDSGKTVDPNRYNRTIDLPKNISYNYNNSKKLVGYNVKIGRNKINYIKSFTLKNLTMEEKLKQVIKYKEQILNSLRKKEVLKP